MGHVPRRLGRARDGRIINWGTMLDPVRTNLPYPGYVGQIPAGASGPAQGQLLTNLPDSWELLQGGPLNWDDVIADDGRPPAWWVGRSVEDACSPVGPHGPWARSSGWALPVITRIVSLLVDPLVSDPFVVQVDRFNPSRPTTALDPPRWITDPQLLRPDGRYPVSPLRAPRRLARNIFWRRWITQAMFWGRSWLWFHEDTSGQPVPGTMQIIADQGVTVDEETGRWLIGDRDEGVWFDDDGYATIGPARTRLVRLDNPHHPDGVFAAHPDVFRLGSKTARYAEGTFNSGVPSGYLKVTAPGLTKPQADELRASWMRAHGGDHRSIAVLSAVTEFHPISWNPVDANLVEVQRQSWAELAWAFGMGFEMLGLSMGNSRTYANVQQDWRMHRDFALSPWVDTIGGTLSPLTPVGQSVTVDLDGYSRPDEAERMDIYAKGITSGVYTVAEARIEEGKVPDADTENLAPEVGA